MGYIIGLILVLSLIFSGGFGIPRIKDLNLLGLIKNKFSNNVFPKTEKELVFDNLNTDIESLEKFFSDETIAKSIGAQRKNKQNYLDTKNKLDSIKKSISKLKDLDENADKSLARSVVERILNLDAGPAVEPDATSIPPQCKLTCD